MEDVAWSLSLGGGAWGSWGCGSWPCFLVPTPSRPHQESVCLSLTSEGVGESLAAQRS